MSNNKKSRRLMWVKIALIAAVSASVTYFGSPKEKDPNIILIVVDTLRPDHLGTYGYKKDTSPTVDALAEDGVVFENAFAQAPGTVPSVASLMSGYLPHEVQVYTNNHPLPFEVKTMAEYLKDDGYSTYAVIGNFMLEMKKKFFQGFDVYDDRMEDTEIVRNMSERIAENQTRRAIELLKEQKSKGDGKFFMWLHYQDPHGPYMPPPPYNEMFYDKNEKPRDLPVGDKNKGLNIIPKYQKLGDHTDTAYYISQYDGEIRYFDQHLKRLIDTLKELDMYDDSMIIFTADHGEGMGEHGLYFAHEDYLYDSLIHVPLIVKYDKKGVRRKENVQLMDLLPTILSVAGIPGDPGFRGKNILMEQPVDREIFSHYSMRDNKAFEEKDISALIVDNYKIIYERGKMNFYNIKNDPNEEHDISGKPEVAGRLKEMKKRLLAIRSVDTLKLKSSNKASDLSEEEKEKFRSLGYLN